jgi:hypothetical protein
MKNFLFSTFSYLPQHDKGDKFENYSIKIRNGIDELSEARETMVKEKTA